MTPSPDSSARYEPSGRICEVRLSGMSLLSLISTCCGPDHPGDPGGPVVVAVHQPDPVRREQERELFHGLIEQGLLRVRPCPCRPGPCGIANSARHEQQVSGSARRHGYGPESSPVPTVPKNARFAGVSGTRTSVPSSDPAFSGPCFPMVTAPGQPRPWCSRQAEPSTRSRSSSRGTGPSAFRQSPAARADAGRHGRAHGTSARSPASAAITSWTRASGISVIKTITRIMNALASSLSRWPFTNRAPSGARPAIPPIDARPGLLLQRPQRRMMHRAALRPDLPVPPDLRLRDRDHLAEHDSAARADLLRPPDHQRRPVTAAQVPAALQRRRQQLQRHRDHHPARDGHGTRRDRVRRRHVRLRSRSGT